MTDPVTRAAKRQNLADRLAEHLAGWGCPPDSASARAQQLLLEVESHGWSLPTVAAPPLSGRGSTDEGRAHARRVLFHTRAGCTCGDGHAPLAAAARVGLEPGQHPVGCPVRDAHDVAPAPVGVTS
jgi:hypothetical protein